MSIISGLLGGIAILWSRFLDLFTCKVRFIKMDIHFSCILLLLLVRYGFVSCISCHTFVYLKMDGAFLHESTIIDSYFDEKSLCQKTSRYLVHLMS